MRHKRNNHWCNANWMRPVVFMSLGMKLCKDKQEPEQLLKPVVFASSELSEVIKKDDDVQPEIQTAVENLDNSGIDVFVKSFPEGALNCQTWAQ